MASHSSLSLEWSPERGHHPLPKQEASSKEDRVSSVPSEDGGSEADDGPSKSITTDSESNFLLKVHLET